MPEDNRNHKAKFVKGEMLGCLKLTGEFSLIKNKLYVECECVCGLKNYWRLYVVKNRSNDKCICSRRIDLTGKIIQENGNKQERVR